MFEDLRAAFKEALDNFNKELSRDQVSETADKLLVGMKNEIVDEKAQVAGLEQQLKRASEQAAREAENARTCRRREEMARGIGDEETAGVAAQHAVRHESHHLVLAKKAEAIREELDFRRRTLGEMMTKFEEARSKRDSLSATAGRSDAREAFSEADDLFSELDRMAEKVESERAYAEGVEALDSLDDMDGTSDYQVELDDEPAPKENLDVDAALAELKRRMGQG